MESNITTAMVALTHLQLSETGPHFLKMEYAEWHQEVEEAPLYTDRWKHLVPVKGSQRLSGRVRIWCSKCGKTEVVSINSNDMTFTAPLFIAVSRGTVRGSVPGFCACVAPSPSGRTDRLLG